MTLLQPANPSVAATVKKAKFAPVKKVQLFLLPVSQVVSINFPFLDA